MRVCSVLVLASAACCVASGAVDPGLVALLPANTQTVLNINAQEARSSDFGQYLLRNLRWDNGKLQEMITATGFDPRRDLVTLLLGSSGGPQAGEAKQKHSFVALARGSFDAQKIGAAALQHGATKENVAGLVMYLTPEGKGQSKAFSFLELDVAVMGDAESVRNVISSRTNATRLNPDLDTLIAKAGGNRDIWFASVDPASQLRGMGGPHGTGQNARLLQSIVQSSGGVQLGSNVEFSLDAVTKTDKDANALADVVRFLASAAQVKKDQDPNASFVGPALDNLSLSTTGNEVHVSTSLPEATLETFVAQIRTHQGRQRPISYSGR